MIESLDNLMRKASEGVKLNENGELECVASDTENNPTERFYQSAADFNETMSGMPINEAVDVLARLLLRVLIAVPEKQRDGFYKSLESEVLKIEKKGVKKTKGKKKGVEKIGEKKNTH